jgi:serine/threonine protein phosphatase 1
MATVVVGDIHGNDRALADLLSVVAGEVSRGDTVVFLGDYVDRGPNSRGVVERLLSFRASTVATAVCLRGNHEDWMLRTAKDPTDHGWLLAMDGLNTVRSYNADAAARLQEAALAAGNRLYSGGVALPYWEFWETMPEDHVAFFEDLDLSWETSDCVCAHAGLNPRIVGLDAQPADALVWGRGTGAFPRGYRGHKPVVYGHRNNAELSPGGWPLPLRLGRTIGLDTSIHGVVSAIRLPEDVLFQSGRHA